MEATSTKRMAGAACFNCPEGRYEEGHTSQLLERENITLVVKDVPALVCDLCGDSLMTGDTVELLQLMLNQAEQRDALFSLRTWKGD